MSLENDNDTRNELYEEFKNTLDDPSSERFYDADDLVIIFDQASDLEDNYVMMEAVMRGYRYFPQDHQLAMRRSQLYFTLEIDEGARQTLSHAPDAQSTLCRIMTLRSQEPMPTKAEAQEALADIVNDTKVLDSEEVIQLVSCAECLDVTQWVYDHEELLRKKADYPTGLVNELYMLAYNSQSYDSKGNNLALKYAEELTEIDPLNGDFWVALAREYGREERYADTHVALDYALAIDSQNIAAIGLKATTLAFEERYAEALDILRDTAMSESPDADSAALYLQLLVRTGRTEEAMDYGARYLEQYCDSQVAVNYLSSFPQMTEPLLDKILGDESYARSIIAKEWADKLHTAGAFDAAAKIYHRLYLNAYLENDEVQRMVSAQYAAGHYVQCLALLQSCIESAPELLTPDICVAGLLSAARLLPKRDTARLLEELRRHFPLRVGGQWRLSSSMAYTSFSAFINTLSNELEHPGELMDESNIFHFFQIPQADNE